MLWLVLIVVVWLTAASCLFLWLAGLWDNPEIPSWSRPWQWLVYLRRGDGSFSEDVYLIASGCFASMPLILCARFFVLSRGGGFRRPAVYGKTAWADQKQMQERGISTSKKPF